MTAQTTASQYPEHDKLKAIAEQSQALGEFIEMSGYTLCTFREAGDNGEPRYIWPKSGQRASRDDYVFGKAVVNPAHDLWSEGYVPTMEGVQTILAEWFEIDQAAIEREKRAMLKALRNA